MFVSQMIINSDLLPIDNGATKLHLTGILMRCTKPSSCASSSLLQVLGGFFLCGDPDFGDFLLSLSGDTRLVEIPIPGPGGMACG